MEARYKGYVKILRKNVIKIAEIGEKRYYLRKINGMGDWLYEILIRGAGNEISRRRILRRDEFP